MRSAPANTARELQCFRPPQHFSPNRTTGVKRHDGNYTHVPYGGGAPLVQALLTSKVRWGLLGTADGRAQFRAGKLKALC